MKLFLLLLKIGAPQIYWFFCIQMFIDDFRYNIDEIIDMMELNEDGKMEFPRDVMVQDCLESSAEPLFGFVTNVTLLTDEPCIPDVECFENGTRIDSEVDMLSDVDDLLHDIDEDDSFRNLTFPASTNNETNKPPELVKILDKEGDFAHRIATIEKHKDVDIQLQMFNASEGISKPNNTQTRLLQRRGLPPHSRLKATILDNTTLSKDNNVPLLRTARFSFSDPDFSRNIDYIFGRNHLTTYRKQGPYQVKSIVPRLPWDHPTISQLQERSDVNYNGNL